MSCLVAQLAAMSATEVLLVVMDMLAGVAIMTVSLCRTNLMHPDSSHWVRLLMLLLAVGGFSLVVGQAFRCCPPELIQVASHLVIAALLLVRDPLRSVLGRH